MKFSTNLLADNVFLGLPMIYWIIGGAVLVALIAIIVIICCAVGAKKSKAKIKAEKGDN